MVALFFRQFSALFRKNWIILAQHPVLNIIRCFLLPVGFGIFLAVAQLFLVKPNNYGLGTPVSINTLEHYFDGSLSLMWADGTNGTSSPTPSEVIANITSGFTSSQLQAVHQITDPDDIPAACPQNFNLFSECFAAVVFYDISPLNSSRPVNYSIRGDGGLVHIDVVKHTSDFELRILPLQWAIDRAIIELQTGVNIPAPLEWPFTQETNEEQSTQIRLSYIRGLRTLLVLALFICYIGIAYQLPGAAGAERASLVTSHMKAMGLLDSARIISWHLSLTLAYLPAWIIVSLVWRYRIFTQTNVGIVIVVHLLLGLVLASWSFFVAAPFGKSPQLAAVASTFLGIVFAILALVLSRVGTGAAFIFSIIFPPSYYIFAIRVICGWENHLQGTSILKGDPDNDLQLLPLIIAAITDVFLWPWLAVLWERYLYDARNPSSGRPLWSLGKKKSIHNSHDLPPGVAISIHSLTKTFQTSSFRPKKGTVTAVSDLTFDIPKLGIYVLLGSNGAGKSTTLSIIGGLTGRSGGSISFEDGERPNRGTIGIVPQKNVLFPELSCYQTLRVWKSVKWSLHSDDDEDIEQLLKDCDLASKIHSNAATLSGGQKRKLQLAIGLIGGSTIVLVDECTSGVDPLSRRSIWRTLTSLRHERTIVFTTHFLDEADLLADHIAILAAPGKLVAQGSPVALKRDLGEGYTVKVSFKNTGTVGEEKMGGLHPEVTTALKTVLPDAYVVFPTHYQAAYHLKSKDTKTVQRILQLLDEKKELWDITSYDIQGSTIEDIFLDLMHKEGDAFFMRPQSEKKLKEDHIYLDTDISSSELHLSDGRLTSPWRQALVIFYKRVLIARRSWLTPLLATLVAISGSTIPLVFLRGRQASCITSFAINATAKIPLFLPISPILPITMNATTRVLDTPPGIIAATLGNASSALEISDVPDNSTFVNMINEDYRNLSLGGVSLDLDSGAALFAWEGTSPGYTSSVMLNLASNLLMGHALNSSRQETDTPHFIEATFESFPPVAAGTLVALKWNAFFGASMAVYPAFFALYVAKERRTSVQAMQFSNGLSNPLGLWIGHLMFDSIFSFIAASVISIIFAVVSNQFHAIGLFWVVLILYGICATLFAYCGSLIVATPLAAFAVVAGYQVIIFVLYLAGYLLTLTYGKTSKAGDIITIIHFTASILSPVASVMRASFVSVNLFSLLCLGTQEVSVADAGAITRFGGPILYLFIYSFILLAILVWVDSGTALRQEVLKLLPSRQSHSSIQTQVAEDVSNESALVAQSSDILRVLNIQKSFGDSAVVDHVSLGVPRDMIFALLGPNGAGKTTTFNIIRGDIIPDSGDILIDGTSVVSHPRRARFSLGVCPQFTAIDSQLTVREHLVIYGRLKGLQIKSHELTSNIDALLKAVRLDIYADRLASRLSGGNQRKLSLAISLIGNPSVILIDEFSTGIDAKMKRDMWSTLRDVSRGKAVIITTHSMEEASALANKVGILAKKMLAVGTTESLSTRYATYEVHFSCRTREEIVLAQNLMSRVPKSRMADDVATRFEVPIQSRNNSLAELFLILSEHGEFAEFAVEKASLESVFLKVIRENNVQEENNESNGRGWWRV